MCRRGRSHTFREWSSHDWARKSARMNEVNSQASTQTEPSEAIWKLRLLNLNFKIVSVFLVIICQVWDSNSTFWEKYQKSFLQSRKAGSTGLLLFNLMTTWQWKLSAAAPFIFYVSSSSSSALAPAQTRTEELPLDPTSVCVSVRGESSERVNLSSGWKRSPAAVGVTLVKTSRSSSSSRSSMCSEKSAGTVCPLIALSSGDLLNTNFHLNSTQQPHSEARRGCHFL